MRETVRSVPELAHKPLVSGAISPRAARFFVLGSLGAMVALSAPLKRSPLAQRS